MDLLIWIAGAVVLLLVLAVLAGRRGRGAGPDQPTPGTGGPTHDTWSTGGGGLS